MIKSLIWAILTHVARVKIALLILWLAGVNDDFYFWKFTPKSNSDIVDLLVIKTINQKQKIVICIYSHVVGDWPKHKCFSCCAFRTINRKHMFGMDL